MATPVGAIKMSEVLEDFAGFYLGQNFDRDQYQTILRLVVLAWNASLLQPDKQDDFLKTIGHLASPGTDPSETLCMVELVTNMILHKREVYSHIRRSIVSFELTETDRRFHLVVASSLDDTPA